MSYKLTTIQKPAYLHITVTGRLSRENVSQYFEDIHRECASHNCFRILIEERLKGRRLNVIDIIELITDESKKEARFLFKAIAYVDLHAEGNSMTFIENVAVNRGLPVTVFSTVADAEQWLLNEAP